MSPATAAERTNDTWLRNYYAGRAVFSLLWVLLAYTVGSAHPAVSAVLIVVYPAWDCLANYFDAMRSGGLRANPSQRLNVFVSALVTVAVGATVARDFHAVIGIIGIWASLTGILQLATALRRWKTAGAQWPMILSGAQSALAGAFFVKMGFDAATRPSVTSVAGYAAVGAVYFAISAAALSLSVRKRTASGTE
ncbi:DUF308 domain-containing protein [Novosphingobium sp. PS1R-30]|uniref:DUF308 domain-containing protein n=1 Tax=Novosphingobium anseongense TaxID=3133436 RepID=A0ABU8RZP4_9SPHN